MLYWALVCVYAATVHPATITVGGSCTLVDAVTAANSDQATGDCSTGSGDDLIVLTGDVTLTELNNTSSGGANGLPVINSVITVDGAGSTIRREPEAPSFRFFQIDAAGDLALHDVALTGGHAPRVDGVATDGGAIWSGGNLILSNTTLSQNTAGAEIGIDAYGSGGAIANEGVLTVHQSTISDNVAGFLGGGIIQRIGSATITQSAVILNTVLYEEGEGGGIRNLNLDPVIVVNSTIAENGAAVGAAIAGPATRTNSTIASNHGSPGGYYSDLWGGDFTLSNTIVARSDEPNTVCGNSASIIDKGGNFDDDGSCGPGFGLITGLETELKDNGGPTQTIALLGGSSAIDAAGDCGLDTDQRDAPRNDGSCDSGAYELQPMIFADGFESGNTSAWSMTTP